MSQLNILNGKLASRPVRDANLPLSVSCRKKTDRGLYNTWTENDTVALAYATINHSSAAKQVKDGQACLSDIITIMFFILNVVLYGYYI